MSAQWQLSHRVKGSSVSQIIMKRLVCLRVRKQGEGQGKVDMSGKH